jgi:hypothetical protein
LPNSQSASATSFPVNKQPSPIIANNALVECNTKVSPLENENLKENSNVSNDLQPKLNLILDKKSAENSNSISTNINSVQDQKTVNTLQQPNYFDNILSTHNMKYVMFLILISMIMFYFMPKTFAFLFSYFVGITLGVLLCIGCFFLAYKLQFIKIDMNFSKSYVPTIEENANSIESLIVPTPYFKENKNFDGVYKGWMNELREVYEPDKYFLNKTRSVYANLDGTMLRLQTTSTRVPKRAVCGESIGSVSFNELRIYDLIGEFFLKSFMIKTKQKIYFSLLQF